VPYDAACAAGGLALAYFVRAVVLQRHLPTFGHAVEVYLRATPAVVGLWVLTAYAVGVYRAPLTSAGRQVGPVLRAGLVGSLVLAGAGFLSHFQYSRAVLALFGVAATGLELAGRCAIGAAFARERASRGPARALVVGVGDLARLVAEKLAGVGPPGYEVLGYVAADGAGSGDVLGRLEDLPSLLDATGADEVFIAALDLDTDRVMTAVDAAADRSATFWLVAGPLEALLAAGPSAGPGGLPVIELPVAVAPSWGYLAAKRGLDILASAAALVLLGPLMLVLARLVRRETGATALFVQERIGLRGRPFPMLKFRTMRPDADPYAPGPGSPDDPRVTRTGQWLRRYSLDELPQLLNVLRGDMSLVGPRPEMPFLVARYQPWQRRRLDAKPGITGLWQILGRKDLPLIDNIEYDFYYLRHRGLLLDLEILARTAPAVLSSRGAY
jgi:exopolysaccharide biosynthesis polyprenyl glycosylphosphotransferase